MGLLWGFTFRNKVMRYTSQWSQTQDSSCLPAPPCSCLGCCDTHIPFLVTHGQASNTELMARDIQCINPMFGASMTDQDSNMGAAEHKLWGAGGHAAKSPLDVQRRTFPGASSRFAVPAGTGVATHPCFPFF